MAQPTLFEKAALLAPLPLFSPLSEEQRLHLAGQCLWQQWPKGHAVFHEGEAALGMHIVLHGLIKIFHTTPEGRERVLHLIKAHNTCGEAAVFQRGTYPAHAATLMPTSVLYVPSAPLLAMIAANPDLALKMLAALSLRLRMFTRKLEAHSSGDAMQRLAAYLLHRAKLAQSPHLHLEMSREVLANMLGIARETLSRMFSRLQQAEILSIKGREIRLTNMAALQQWAEKESAALPQTPAGG
ncbi:MAG: Crp/Fnr family transcriptional regulator [Desulfovibrionaceae bacterium]